MNNQEIIKRLYSMMYHPDYNEIDDPLNIGLLIEDIHEENNHNYITYYNG